MKLMYYETRSIQTCNDSVSKAIFSCTQLLQNVMSLLVTIKPNNLFNTMGRVEKMVLIERGLTFELRE